MMKNVAEQMREEWRALAVQANHKGSRWISENLIRPFLFFTSKPSTLHQMCRPSTVECMLICFKFLLRSINSVDAEENYCSLAAGTLEDKHMWLYQAKKLVALCFFILAECDQTAVGCENVIPLTALATRLAVTLTDPKGWKSFRNDHAGDADIAVRKLIEHMTARGNTIYICIRIYLMKLGIHVPSQKKATAATDESFLITASVITLALRPFHFKKSNDRDMGQFLLQDTYRQYFSFILTVPYLTKRLPPLLLPALKHESTLTPCLTTLLISKDKIFNDMLKLDQSKISLSNTEAVPYHGWSLANIVNLATEHNIDDNDYGHFVPGLDCKLYVDVVNCISENFLSWIENAGGVKGKDNGECSKKNDTSSQVVDSSNSVKLKSSYLEFLKAVHQQWHLRKLWAFAKKNVPYQESDARANQHFKAPNFEQLNVIFFYYYMLRIFSSLIPSVGSLPVLNLLSFNPGFLVELWEALETSIFCGTTHNSHDTKPSKDDTSMYFREAASSKKQARVAKESGSKWADVLQKIAGRSADMGNVEISNDPPNSNHTSEHADEFWDVESMRGGAQGITKDLSCMLYLFCATYAHLLLVLDDIEFYEKQAPFTLQQQRIIASVLNTFVYNTFIQNGGQNSKPIMDVAVRCLHLLYERDCRHKFCSSALWLAPARVGRIPIAAAARAHEATFTNFQSRDVLIISSMSSIFTTVPYVYPFEERVQMFREFVKLDKVSRRAAGELSGPGPGSIEISVRRDHIVEDGYRQLNFLGSRLKSRINVSFISECGLPEAGLDYGGLSKEFLTDLSKAAFDPRSGLFSQTSTSECNLIPNVYARFLDNGIQLIEFLGRVVGKALYEGILLDYSFSLVFVQKLLGRYSFLDELSTLDSELYRNLMYVKHYEGDVAELSLDFTVTEEICGKLVVIELKPGGGDVPVTNENKLQYVHAMADYKLNRQLLPFANSFYRGLTDLISPSWLSLFNANEFNQLLSGGSHDFDVDDLRSNTRYTGGYSEGSRTVKLFWEVIRGFTPNERCMLLKFVTSCSRAPLLGFKHLHPSFIIHKVACDLPIWASIGGQDVDRLPSASTCYNTLKLPTYKRPSTLRNKLLYAISSNTGFELS